MLPLNLFKFGKRKDVEPPISDTPITRLSKILSQTSFVEPRNSHRCDNVPLTSISESIPADIDESANQEPPPKGFTAWHDSNELGTSVIPSSRPLLTRDFSNSCSSGYYSSSTTTQSAPPTCNIDRLQVCPSTDRCSLPNSLPVFSDSHPGKVTTTTTNDSTPAYPHKTTALRRTQSCNRGWLAKRHRKQTWPRISGIMKPTTPEILSPSQAIVDTNSCPATLQTDHTNSANPMLLRRYSLPPVGESCPFADASPSPPAALELFTKFSLSPINTSDEAASDAMDLSVTFHPQAKKLRTESPSRSLPFVGQPELDSTLPLEDRSMEEPDALPKLAGEQVTRPNKPLFDMFRHQSTPMLATRAIPFTCPTVPSPPMPLGPRAEQKPSLSRCVSVPVQNLSEKLSRCMSVLDNHNARFEDRRPRALPVVDRTASGLHCVSTDTVAELVSEAAPKRNVRHVIVDCRFPYEYEGGHIQGAINIFTHSDLVQEIFNRVPAQRPPGASGPPRLLGEGLARRLAMTLKEPLSAPCEPLSDEDSVDDADQEDAFGQTTFGDASDLELAGESSSMSEHNSRNDDDSPSCRSEPDLSLLSQGSSANGKSSQEPAFVVIFHCEFSSQRAPDLATFLRSIDRVSNYHRYPFLYFPEIYIMKGGYSAFYRKHAHLCCPQNYVKMFHRDYRTQLRLYKRLTKRVSSACLACIRPQHQLLQTAEQPSDAAAARAATSVDTVNSFGQVFVPATHPAMIAAAMITATANANMPAASPVKSSASTEARLAVIDSMMRGNQVDRSNPWTGLDSVIDDDEEDKENRSPISTSPNQMPLSSPIMIELSHSSEKSPQPCASFGCDPVESPVSGGGSSRRSSGSDSPGLHNRTAFSDSPLSLAEVVVRVGRSVIAATLSSADPSAAAKLRHNFNQPCSSSGDGTAAADVSESHALKRRNTVNDLYVPRQNNPTSRLGKRDLRLPIPFTVGCPDVFGDPSCCTQTTPALGLKRAQTLEFTPVHSRSQGRFETPIAPRQILHATSHRKLDVVDCVPPNGQSCSASPNGTH